jgi:hypothetical protein
MPGALVCFNCKSRRTPCVSQSGDGARLQLRRRPESDSPRNSSSEAPTWAARNPSVPQAPDVLENSVTDRRAPFLAVLGPSGVSPPCWHAVLRSADLTRQHSSPNLPRRTMPVRQIGHVWAGTAVCLTRQQVTVGHLVFPADCLSHSHPARGKVYARHYVQDYRPTILS